MALKRILQSEDMYAQPEDLPWANVYVKTAEDLTITYFVKAFFAYDSGLMVVTPCFKGFIHTGTQLHQHLIEALPVFVEQPARTLDELVATVGKKGKIQLLTDDSRKASHWIYYATDSKYVQVYAGTAEEENILKSNPFLAGMGLRNARTEEEEQQDNVPKAQPKAARKPPRDV